MIVLIFFMAWLIGHIVEEMRKYACHCKDVELKRDLVDRGLSAEEIERIVAAQGRPTIGEEKDERIVAGELAAK